MLNEVLHLTNGAPFAQCHENGEELDSIDPIKERIDKFLNDGFISRSVAAKEYSIKKYNEFVNNAVFNTYKAYDLVELKNTSCFGCKYDDCEVDEEERKANCLSCLEPVTIRKNFVGREDALHVKDK